MPKLFCVNLSSHRLLNRTNLFSELSTLALESYNAVE